MLWKKTESFWKTGFTESIKWKRAVNDDSIRQLHTIDM